MPTEWMSSTVVRVTRYTDRVFCRDKRHRGTVVLWRGQQWKVTEREWNRREREWNYSLIPTRELLA